MPRNRGQHKKPTEDEHDERVKFTADLLASGKFKSQIKSEVKERYSVDARTVEKYISLARTLLLSELNQPRDVHKSDALGFYRSIVSDPSAKMSDRIGAQKRIDFILGLHAPTRVAFTDANGRTLGRSEVEAAIDNLAEGVLGAGPASEAS